MLRNLLVKSLRFLFLTAVVFVSVSAVSHVDVAKAAPVTINCSGTSGSPTAVTESAINPTDDVTFVDAGGDGWCVLDEAISCASVVIGDGVGGNVILTHTATDVDGVTITTTGDLTINTGSSINASAKGCVSGGANGFGPNGSNVCIISTAGYGYGGGHSTGGGGHGGAGGRGSVYSGGVTYGSATNPVLFGSSAGGNGGGSGGNGGGLVILSVSGTFTHNGSISVDGGVNAVGALGGGAGGSINITTGSMTGTTGIFSANGGNGNWYSGSSWGGGGGGGRIAIKYNSSDFSFDSSDFSVAGGTTTSPAVNGSKGTVYVEDTDDNIVNIYHGFSYSTDYSEASWTVDSSATNQYCDGADATPSITTTGALSLSGTFACTHSSVTGFDTASSTSVALTDFTFTMNETDIWTMDDAVPVTLTGTTVNSNVQWTNITTLSVDSSSSINANAKGCASSGSTDGYGPNASNVCMHQTAGYGNGGGAYGTQGGGHGGAGGAGSSLWGNGATYGSSTAPVLFGSSGGPNGGGAGGTGGGLIRLQITGTFTHNGAISADGGAGNSGAQSGGGSGGSIYITAGSIIENGGATGTISAVGGDGYNGASDGGGGGGGRVAIEYGGDPDSLVSSLVGATITAGGLGPDAAADGAVGTLSLTQTVYLNSITITDNSGYTNDSTPVITISQSGATPTHVAFSCDNSNWSSWLAYPDDDVVNDGDGPAFDITSDAIGCSATNELKTIYAKIKDGSSESSVVSDATTYDTAPPGVMNVDATNPNGTYTTDDVLTITVQFDESTIVVTGTPQIELDMNGTDRLANYVSTATDTLSFTYTIVNGDNKTDLDYTGTDALALNGGTISDLAGNTAILTLPSPGSGGSLASNTDLTISTNQAPTVSTVSGVQLTDGTGGVTAQFTLDDADGDDTLQAKVEYNIGGGWTKATILETSGTGSSFGQFNVENDNAYQVGNSNGYIITLPSENEITVVWDSATDEPTANLSTAQIRITPYDGIEAGSATTSSNFTIDNVDPASLASFASSADTSTTVTLTWTAATDTNFDHYEIWYGTSQPAVEGRTASEWDNSDDATLATATTATTTVTGLTAAQTYYMKIWVIDDYGNSSTLPTITVNNNGLPTASTLTGAQTTTGNGVVNISFVADDSNDDDTLQYKLEYYVGGSWTKATILETSGTGASYGQFNVENDNAYQIGNSNGYITSSEGANTITIIWNAQTDLGTTDTASAQVRVTPYDGTETGSILTSDAFTLDQADPAGGLTSLSSAGVVYTSFTLGWSAITTESNFDKYQIYYKLSSASTYTLYSEESTMTTGSKAITGLTEGTTYTFYVKALDTFGNSLTSTTLSVTMEDTSNPYFGAITGGGSAGASSWWLNPVEITIEIPPTTDTSEGSSSGQSEEEQEEEVIEEVTENFEEVWEEEAVEQLSGHWAEPYLKDFYETTLINEIFQNETSDAQIITYLLNPDQQMTRINFLKSAMDILSIDVAHEVQYVPFTDMTSDSEYVEYAVSAYNMGIISGYADGTFNPDGDINRAESLKIIFNIIGENITPLTGRPLLEYYDLPSNPFPDVDIDAWYAPYVIYAYMNGVVSDYGDGYFRPERTISLGEMAKILTIAVKLMES